MLFSLGVAVVTAIVLIAVLQYNGLQRHVAEARKSGFHYVVAPVFFQSIPWMIFQEPLLPLLQKLPKNLTEKWLPLSLFHRIWHAGHKPFADIGHDTFLIASPAGNILWTCEPNILTQVFSRRQDFVKPVAMLSMLNIYGPTITASEGEEHMVYRKIASPSFNETTHQGVWNATIHESEGMAQIWSQANGKAVDLDNDCSRQALHILSKVFFGKTIQWVDDKSPPPGHSLTYGQAASAVFKHAGVLFMTPKPVLNNSPAEIHKTARTAFREFGKYMEEMKTETTKDLEASSVSSEQKDSLLETLVRAGLPQTGGKQPQLSPEAVFGNIFIFVLAGHETSSNSLTIAITLLAINAEFQKALQADIDSIFPDGVHETEKSYAGDFHKLWQSRVGALMQEVLRLYPVLPFLPKINPQPQSLTVGKETFTLPANTTVMADVAALHRNPKYWPQENGSTPVAAFRPEQWLDASRTAKGEKSSANAYMPFSEGFRSCMGTRFAQIEFCASIAKVFSEWSVELEDNTPAGVKAAEELLTSRMQFEMGLKMERPAVLKFTRRGA